MNRDLQELVRKYATEAHTSVGAFLHGKSKDNLIGILMDLLTNYFTDKNSSALREHVIVSLCGYQVSREKIGYNGYRQDAISGEPVYCEAKPKNINTGDARPRKLDGGGNFTDYTWARFEKNKKANPEMIVGGFVDGRLLYVLRFPFNTPKFTAVWSRNWNGICRTAMSPAVMSGARVLPLSTTRARMCRRRLSPTN